MLNQTLKEEDTVVCVAEIMHVRSCMYLFQKYLPSIHYTPDTILGVSLGILKSRIDAHTGASQIVLSCSLCIGYFDPSKCNAKFSPLTSFQKKSFSTKHRVGGSFY